jgi:hypothetical protein
MIHFIVIRCEWAVRMMKRWWCRVQGGNVAIRRKERYTTCRIGAIRIRRERWHRIGERRDKPRIERQCRWSRWRRWRWIVVRCSRCCTRETWHGKIWIYFQCARFGFFLSTPFSTTILEPRNMSIHQSIAHDDTIVLDKLFRQANIWIVSARWLCTSDMFLSFFFFSTCSCWIYNMKQTVKQKVKLTKLERELLVNLFFRPVLLDCRHRDNLEHRTKFDIE